MSPVATRHRSEIARRLIVAVVLFSAAITLVISAFQLYRDYQRDLSVIDARLQQIEDVNLKTLSNSLWVADQREMKTHLEGILRLPDMQYLEIRENEKLWASVGKPKTKNVITRTYPMYHNYRGERQIIGQLKVTATLEHVYERLIDKAIVILISNGIKTFLVAGFILIIFQRMVTRHLIKIADFAQSRNLNQLHKPLQLDRKESNKPDSDELNTVVFALNQMQSNLHHSFVALRESEAQIRLLLDSTAEAIFGVDPQGACTFINPACLRMLGYEKEQDLIGKNISTLLLLPAKNEAHSTAADDLPLNTITAVAYHREESVFFRRDGSSFPVEWWSHPIYQNQDVVGAVVTFFDISEQKQAQDELQRHRNHLEELVAERTEMIRQQARIIDQIHDSVVSTDLDGMITSWNHGAERLFGFKADEAIGKHISFVYPQQEHNFLLERATKQLQEKGDYETEVRILRKNGQLFHTHLSLSLLYDDHGDPSGMIGYSLDITARKQAEDVAKRKEQDLVASNRELEAFSYSVSHDLRAPLRTIDGYSKILLEDYGDVLDDDGKHYLQRIGTGTERMSQLIDDLLHLSRLTRREFHPAMVNLSTLAQQIGERLQKTDPDHSAEISIQPGLVVEGDKGLLEIALENLLENAWKYSSKTERPQIEFGLLQQAGQDTYYVRDNGAGFDMEYAHKLFDPFQRLHGKDDFPGTGLGLAIVQRIIHRHGGRIWAEAAAGKGACFYFTFGS
jgi:PAS domain S-box-containing protein